MSELFETYDDAGLLALASWREARGEGAQGMTAVMCVILNRVKDWGVSLREAVLGRNQFTSFSPDDPEYRLYPRADDGVFAAMTQAAVQMLAGNYEDITGGAHYYANLVSAQAGGWFEREIVGSPSAHPFAAKLGRHSFYV